MGVILGDLEQKDRNLCLSWWNWRPIIELIRSLNLIDDEMMELMGYNGGFGELSAEQAHIVGRRLKEEVLPKIQPEDRVLLDLSTTTQSDDGTMHYDNQFKNYSATRGWIEKFADFCLSSQGFKVY